MTTPTYEKFRAEIVEHFRQMVEDPGALRSKCGDLWLEKAAGGIVLSRAAAKELLRAYQQDTRK